MPVKESNTRIQITIDKDVLKYLDYIVKEINRYTRTGYTRSSILVNSFITLFMSEAAKVQEKNNNLKKEEEDQ